MPFDRAASLLCLLLLIGALALPACATDDNAPAGNTELNVVVPNNGGQSLSPTGQPQPAFIDIQTVEYTIDCAGNDDTFLDNNASFDDAVTINGNLEVQDGRTNIDAIYPGYPAGDGQAEIWQGFMDLPPGPCTIELRARDGDGEVICTAREPFIITADSLTKVNIVLICDISFQAPVGTLDVDGTFSFNVGNFCPDLFVLNCMDEFPQEAPLLPGLPPIAATTCEVRFRDGDSTCGAGCDPQTCGPDGNSGLVCAPGADPGVSTTVSCVDALIDCDFDLLTTEAQCVFTGDTLGALGTPPPNVPGAGAFAVACVPPSLGGIPGAEASCTAVTTDGDQDCDKTKTVSIRCAGDPPCWTFAVDNGFEFSQAGADAACQSFLPTVCETSVCDDSSGVPVCVDSIAPEGTDCSAESPPIAECMAGVCESISCLDDASCDTDGSSCTFAAPGTCDIVTGICNPLANEPSGTACDAGLGPDSGACDGGGTCEDICDFNPPCPPPTGIDAPCLAADCDGTDGSCRFVAANDGATCDSFLPPPLDGTCIGGVCFPGHDNCGTTFGTIQIACSNGVTDAQSPFPNQLTITVNDTVFAGFPFQVDASGIGAFPQFFLDAAQLTVPGGVRAAIVEGFNATVEANNGTGQILLQADPGGISPGLTQFCQYPSSLVCTQDSDCIVPPCNAPVLLAGVPLSEDCGPGGVCEGLGQGSGDGAGAQCNITDPPSFCVTSDLLVPLFAPGGIQSMTAGASGEVIFNWAIDPATETCGAGSTSPRCTENGGNLPDGSLILPPSIYGDPVGNPASVGLNGIRLNVGGALFVALQCTAGQDGGACSVTTTTGCLSDADCPGTETCIGVGVDDDIIMPTDLSLVPTRCFIN